MSERIKQGSVLAGLALLFFCLPPAAAQTQEERVLTLERQLQERDRVILELLERVEALERRVGLQRRALQPQEDSRSLKEQEAEAPAAAEQDGGDEGERPPGMIVVEKGEAERALERALAGAGALLLPEGILEFEPGFRYARDEDSSPRLSRVNGQFLIVEQERITDSLTTDVGLRLGLPWDAQLEVGMPYRWRHEERVDNIDFAPVGLSSRSGAGFGDVRLGLAKTLLREKRWRPDLIGRITWDTGSGELFDGEVPLGGGFDEIRSSLTAIKRQDPIVFVGGLSYEYSFEEDQIQPGSVLAGNINGYIALSPESSLSFGFLGAYQRESEIFGEEIIGSDRTFAVFGVGGSTLLASRLLMNLSLEIGLTHDADDFALSLSFPFRFSKPLY